MGTYKLQLIETGICIASFIILKFAVKYIIRITVNKASFKAKEEKEILRLINLLLVIITVVIITAIWGVKQGEILLFATSVISVLGIALFAEMSILSNISACLILFFNHPVKIGDTIKLYYEENIVEGELIDITYFFVYIKMKESQVVSIPNNILLQTPFSIIDKDKLTKKN